ncbi:MAG: FAD-dependent monooxygenase, partial [Caulobacter sp.]|nr:FAD-dependent monooxygenase [Caulobacter sp.]
MLRISELKLPLGHPPEAMAPAIVTRLGIEADDLVSFAVARRAHDARRKSAILMVYSVDVVLRDEAAVLSRFEGDHQVRVTPDTDYRFVAKAPAGFEGPRPVVIGAGPCGLFAGLILAQMGLRPIIVDRGKVVRERTKDTWGLWR